MQCSNTVHQYIKFDWFKSANSIRRCRIWLSGHVEFGVFFSFLFASARYPKMKEEYLERQGENGEMNAQGQTL